MPASVQNQPELAYSGSSSRVPGTILQGRETVYVVLVRVRCLYVDDVCYASVDEEGCEEQDENAEVALS